MCLKMAASPSTEYLLKSIATRVMFRVIFDVILSLIMYGLAFMLHGKTGTQHKTQPNKIEKPLMYTAVSLWHLRRDSNPCCRLERAVS